MDNVFAWRLIDDGWYTDVLSVYYLGAFEEECVPDVEVGVDGERVHEEAEEPVEGEEGGVHPVGVQVLSQQRQLLRHQLLEHGLVHLPSYS